VTNAAAPLEAPELPRIALLGSPNSGKTTLFNALTGARARVANHPGVTVDLREGMLRSAERPVRLLDLPGTYSLRTETPDERLTHDLIAGMLPDEAAPDAILVVVDGTSLERGLGLLAQALEFDLPTTLVVTMIDEVRARGGSIDVPRLSRRLGIPAVGIVGHRGVGVPAVRRLLQEPERWPHAAERPPTATPEERFAWVDGLIADLEPEPLGRDARTEALDRVLLHPIAGVALFGAVMVLLFQSIFAWALPAMDAIDGGVAALASQSRETLPPGWGRELWTDGVLAGVGAVLVFLPQIVILFTLIHFLEDVGYMARAAFVVDRVMGWVGLQGRCFVSLLSSYACAVPGIMATRTIGSPRDRLATILVAPFMTCSARLPVYTLLIAAFIPAVPVLGPLGLQGLTMLGLYVLGTGTAFGMAALLNSTVLRGTPATFYLELPPYRIPTLKLLATQVWGSVRAFLRRAGTIILGVSILLWALLSFPRLPVAPEVPPQEQARLQLEHSVAGRVGRAIEPLIEPLGYDWRIGVGLLSSLAAREVLVSAMAQIYAVEDPDSFDGLRTALREDRDPSTGARRFTLATAISVLVFFVFALQCTSTVVVMGRETRSWRWPAFAFTYMLVLAYGASFVSYRIASALL
jgi:ferrous iron transport protein B